MSAEAVATLRQRWEKLTFARVGRVIAREPEDVLSIVAYDDIGKIKYYMKSRRTADIPEGDRARARVSWRHYYGFTDNGIHFQIGNYHGLDCDIDLTMDFSQWGNHNGGYDRPEVGSSIAGEVIDTPKGKRFKRWFHCPPELEFLIQIVLNGTKLSENDLAPHLITRGYPDKYWAIARLVFFENVQAFVDELKPVDLKKEDTRPLHPAHGMFTGSVTDLGERLMVRHRGMWLSMAVPQFVHEISYRLNEPRWWEEFKLLAAEQKFAHSHPPMGGWCNACAAERGVRRREGSPYPDYYDYF